MLRKSATTTPKQYQTTWCFRKDWQHAGGTGDLQSENVFPGSCHSVGLAKALLFVKAGTILGKKVTAAISF